MRLLDQLACLVLLHPEQRNEEFDFDGEASIRWPNARIARDGEIIGQGDARVIRNEPCPSHETRRITSGKELLRIRAGPVIATEPLRRGERDRQPSVVGLGRSFSSASDRGDGLVDDRRGFLHGDSFS